MFDRMGDSCKRELIGRFSGERRKEYYCKSNVGMDFLMLLFYFELYADELRCYLHENLSNHPRIITS